MNDWQRVEIGSIWLLSRRQSSHVLAGRLYVRIFEEFGLVRQTSVVEFGTMCTDYGDRGWVSQIADEGL